MGIEKGNYLSLKVQGKISWEMMSVYGVSQEKMARKSILGREEHHSLRHE